MSRVRKNPKKTRTSRFVSYTFISETLTATNDDLINTINVLNDVYKNVMLLNVSDDVKFPIFRDIWFSVKLLGDLVTKNEEIFKMITVNGELRCKRFDMTKEPVELLHFSNVMEKTIIFNDLANGTKVYILNDLVSSFISTLHVLKETYTDNEVNEFKAIILNFGGFSEEDDVDKVFDSLLKEAERRRDCFRIMNYKVGRVIEGRSAPIQKFITKGVI